MFSDKPKDPISVRLSNEDSDILYDFQHDILPRSYFYNGKIKEIVTKLLEKDSIYNMLKIYYEFYNMNNGENLQFPYEKNEFSVSEECIKSPEDKNFNINVLVLTFPEDLNPPIAYKIFALYDDLYERSRYFTLEYTGFADGSYYLCEVVKQGITNYGRVENNLDKIKNIIMSMGQVEPLDKDDFEMWKFDEENNINVMDDNFMDIEGSIGGVWGYRENVHTKRGIRVGDNIDKVFKSHGYVETFDYNENGDVLYDLCKRLVNSKVDYFEDFDDGMKIVQYKYTYDYKQATLSFYYDKNNKIKLIGIVTFDFSFDKNEVE